VIQDDPSLAKDIKMIGIGIANNRKLLDVYKTNFRVPFPLFPDEKGDVFMVVGKPSTPTLVLATTAGKVLMSHAGLITDFDGLVKEIREIHKKQ
jgi:hypothetical protein